MPDTKGDKSSELTHRLFLSQVDLSLGRQTLTNELSKLFSSYGKVTEVFIPERSTKSYAFISFEHPEEAQSALRDLSSETSPSGSQHKLFQRVKPAQPIRNNKEQLSKKKAKAEFKITFDLAIRSNIICQLPKSHVERLVDFLNQYQEKCIVVGSLPSTKCKTLSLVFVKTTTENGVVQFVEWLNSLWFLKHIMHRVYCVHQQIRGTLEKDVVEGLFSIWKNTTKAAIRLQVFPPKYQRSLLKAVDEQWNRFPNPEAIEFSPTNPSYTVSVVALDDGPGPDDQGGLYAIGMQPISSIPGASSTPKLGNDSETASNDDICRAHWKLQETFERYSHDLPDINKTRIALDCGAAPGGWTKYLSERLNCETIYSVDPGALAPSVLQIPQVQHMALTIQKTLPKLQSEGIVIDVWVSDMCVKDMEQQIDWLLKARDMGVVAKGTFFVLTLKCIIGHSTNTFDILVDQEIKRLEGISEKIQRLHLFFNRISERTIVGYLT